MVFAVLVVGFSGCVDKQSTESNTKSTEAAQSSVKLPSQYILLNRSAELKDYIGDYTKAASGKTFLVIEMTLENHGYKTFSINPNYFTVVIDSVAYPYDSATFLTLSPLTSVALLDGGKASGYLVFQIPDGKTQYNIIYVGQGDYEFIYGELPTAETAKTNSEPPKPVRAIMVDLGSGLRTITGKGSESFGEIRDGPGNLLGYKDHFSTEVDVSQPGYVMQETNGESDKGVSIDVAIKTILDENLKPTNQNQALKDEINKKINDLSSGGKYKIKETGSSEIVLKTGYKATVHEIKVYVTNGQTPPKKSVNVFGYMLDGDTMVIVDFSPSSPITKNLIAQTLSIGEMQNL